MLSEIDIHPDVVAAGKGLRYLELVSMGNSPRMAEVFALQSPPGIGITNSQYLQDQNRWGTSILDRMNGNHRAVETLRKGLAKNGYKLKSDDHYISTAANGRHDPMAIVNEHQTFKELEARVAAKAKAEKPTPKGCRLSPTIVERIRQREISANPDVAHKDQQEVVANIIDKHGSRAKGVNRD